MPEGKGVPKSACLHEVVASVHAMLVSFLDANWRACPIFHVCDTDKYCKLSVRESLTVKAR